MPMEEVIPRLWIGDLPSAQDAANLKSHDIFSIVSALRGDLTSRGTFLRHQVPIDDTETQDILQHLLPSIRFIQEHLDEARGVLVHCVAGISRSATIVASYLMYTQNLDQDAALENIRRVRPSISPNLGFLRQLKIFHQALLRVSQSYENKDMAARMVYLEQTLGDLTQMQSENDNNAAAAPREYLFKTLPNVQTLANPKNFRRRIIRCRMCRNELAQREHMLEHDSVKLVSNSIKKTAVPLSPASPELPPILSNPKCSGYFVSPVNSSVLFLCELEFSR